MTRPLRFCMVTTFYPPYHFGGDAVFVHRLAEALADNGHAVHVIHSIDAYHLQHPGAPEVEFTHHPRVERFPLDTARPRLATLGAHQFGSAAFYAQKLRGIFARHEYDVIHYHNISLMGGPGVLRLGHAIKLYTTHEYWLVCPTHVLFRFGREACTRRTCLRCTLHARRPPQLWRYTDKLDDCVRHVDLFLMPSRFALERHRADGIDAPMTVLPNFVPVPTDAELAAGRGSSHDARESGDERPFFLFVGRLEKLKGVQDVIPIFGDYAEARLVIVGTGDYEAELRAQASGLANVEFRGYVHPSEIGRLYREAIAVLAPSLCYEVFPLIAAEALAHGTPVIGRRIGGLGDVIAESGGGLAFDTVEECRQAMDRLRGDPKLRALLGARGRRMAVERWTREAHLTRYLEIVGELRERRAAEHVPVAAVAARDTVT